MDDDETDTLLDIASVREIRRLVFELYGVVESLKERVAHLEKRSANTEIVVSLMQDRLM